MNVRLKSLLLGSVFNGPHMHRIGAFHAVAIRLAHLQRQADERAEGVGEVVV